MKDLKIHNNQAVNIDDIPELSYTDFLEENVSLLASHPQRHCVNYFGVSQGSLIHLYCCIADDWTNEIYINRSALPDKSTVSSLTAQNHNFERFERVIHEQHGIAYTDHPWLKPVRFAHNRANKQMSVGDYPFYSSESEELHEVGVGPIHAGIIEPGHFRFICNGEQILHLEIQLGYQHRGVEELFLQKTKLLERATLAESIAGDTAVGHGTAFANLWESLCGFETDESLHFSRTLALELERIAIHTGDLAAICADIAYQLGSSVYGRLRTPIVNFFQEWGGNRLAKGLIRPGKMNYPFTQHLAERLMEIFAAYEPDFDEMSAQFFSLPSCLSRLERTGTVTLDQAKEIGTVGMAARTSGLERDIRKSHPSNLYQSTIRHMPIIKHLGDVFSRTQIRKEEVKQSVNYCKRIIQHVPAFVPPQPVSLMPQGGKFAISLVEGWRGEICHCAITDEQGNLLAYRIKDPSHHNWMALAQAVRSNEISDFPVCNKSFNLSYCGHDL
jgi:Ni,Fe-hydrogenase III large subunit